MKSDFSLGILIGITIGLIFLTVLLTVTRNGCNTWVTWYPNSGLQVIEKANGEKFGKYQYTIQDAYKDNDIKLIIRSNINWSIGDTLFLSNKKP